MVTLTERAAKEVSVIMNEQRDKACADGQDPKTFYLRVGVKGGGCSGFSYSLDVAETKAENDEVWEQHGVTVVCDTKSHLYLDGTTVDFKDEIMGRGFTFQNPNATSSCGCGSSCTNLFRPVAIAKEAGWNNGTLSWRRPSISEPIGVRSRRCTSFNSGSTQPTSRGRTNISWPSRTTPLWENV